MRMIVLPIDSKSVCDQVMVPSRWQATTWINDDPFADIITKPQWLKLYFIACEELYYHLLSLKHFRYILISEHMHFITICILYAVTRRCPVASLGACACKKKSKINWKQLLDLIFIYFLCTCNTVNPVYDVAIICHQVCSICWGASKSLSYTCVSFQLIYSFL